MFIGLGRFPSVVFGCPLATAKKGKHEGGDSITIAELVREAGHERLLAFQHLDHQVREYLEPCPSGQAAQPPPPRLIDSATANDSTGLERASSSSISLR